MIPNWTVTNMSVLETVEMCAYIHRENVTDHHWGIIFFNVFVTVMCDTVEPSFVHWMSLITKAATVFYYNRRGSVPEHTKYKAAHLVLFLNTPSTRQHI